MKSLINYLTEIQEHFESEYPREGCGVLGIVKGRLHWYPCTNIAPSEQDFILDSTEYFNIKKIADIVGIVHSHPDAPSTPSQTDIDNCNALGIPYYIFSYPGMDLEVVTPRYNQTELYGRTYSFGTKDCFEASKDWYKEIGIELPPRDPYEDDWWKKGLDYFSEEYLNSWKFYKVTDVQPNDLLVFSVDSGVPNHCGVYVNNDIFFHHAQNRLSCKENLYPFWIKYLTGIYRYDA